MCSEDVASLIFLIVTGYAANILAVFITFSMLNRKTAHRIRYAILGGIIPWLLAAVGIAASISVTIFVFIKFAFTDDPDYDM